MRNETYKCGTNYEVIIAVPTTVQEFDTLAKKEGACVSAAVDHEVYHGTLGEVREKVVKLIEKEFGVQRREIGTGRFEGEGDAKTEITKTEGFETFLNRVSAEKKLNGDKPFAKFFAAVSVGGASEVKLDPSATARKPGKPPKLPNEYLNVAKQLIEAKQVAGFGKRYQKVLGKELVYDKALTGDALATAIGWLIREMKLVENKIQSLDAVVAK